MSDQNEATTVVIVFEVVVPGILHVIVLKTARERPTAPASRNAGAKAGQCDLPIQRRIRAALRSKLRELLANDVELGRIGSHVAVGSRIGGYGRIDIEAIDRGIRIGLRCFAR